MPGSAVSSSSTYFWLFLEHDSSWVSEYCVLYVVVGDNPSPVFTVSTLQKMEQDDESQRVIRNVYPLSLSHNAISKCEHTPHTHPTPHPTTSPPSPLPLTHLLYVYWNNNTYCILCVYVCCILSPTGCAIVVYSTLCTYMTAHTFTSVELCTHTVVHTYII